jgi:hypothetical protein
MNLTSFVRFFRRTGRLPAAALLLATAAQAQNFTTYDLVVPVSSTADLLTVDGAGRTMPENRSYVIGLEGGTRGAIALTNWVGTPEFPVVIVNKHGSGRVTVTDVVPGSTTYTRRDGIALVNCKYVQLRGDNDPAYRYGIEVAQVGNKAGHSRVGVNITGTSSDVEVSFVEVHDSGFAGIMAKTDPSCSNPNVWAANFVMRNINIRDTYVHDTGGEGMYIGYTHWRDEVTGCSPTPPVPIFGHEIHGLRISYNLIERSGWDGAQVASNPVDTKVHDNVIIHSGLTAVPGQGNGFQVGGGGTGEYFNNVIIDSAFNALVVLDQIGNVSVYNNLMIDMGDYGIFAKNGPRPPPSDPDERQTIPGTFVSFYNNTVVNPVNAAYYTIDNISVNNWKNNLSIVPNTSFVDVVTDGIATVNTAGNLMQRDYTGLDFVNPAENDFRIKTSSNAANVGVSLASLSAPEVPVTTDFQGIARPQGAAYDAGFNEAGPLSVYLIATPPTTGNTGSVKASAIGGTAPYTYAWSTGATSQTISSLPQGLYSVTVTDAVGAKMTRATYLVDGADMGAPVRVTPPNEVLPITFSPAPGTYTSAQTITLSSATAGDTIRYTTDGSLPTTSHGATYGGVPITLTGTTTLKAIAYKSGMETSVLAVGTYVFDNGPTNTKFTVTNADITESAHTGSANTKDKTIDGSLTTQWQSRSLITYFPSSSWTSAAVTGAYDNDVHSSATTDAYFNAHLVNGTEISWYGAKGPNGGIAAVSIDGGAETLVDTYAATAVQNQLLFTSGVLPQGGHILKVRVTGTKNASSSGYTITADRFVTNATTYNDDADRQWIRYDLGSNQRVAFLKLGFANAAQSTYRFEIQTSTDDINYTSLIDGRVDQEPTYFLSSRDTGLQIYDLPDLEPVRYVRLVGHGNNNGNKNLQPNNGYTEVEIWGGAVGSALPRGVYQAESATLSGPTVKTNQTGYTGTGFVQFTNATGDYIEWTVTNPTASTRGLTFRYQHGGSPRSVSISVNGSVVEPSLSFTGTGAPGVWVDRAVSAALPAGTVTIRMTTTGTSGPNIDSLRID